jgi:PPM family protein phosphatase
VRVPPGFAVGVCSHTGRVRSSNEDDYLLAALPQAGPLLAAVADGMGGLFGGAEASRTALRALGAAVLEGGVEVPPGERLLAGFTAASARVHEAASAVPALRDMGTTMTALLFTGHPC